MPESLIVVVGPTASGKTELAVCLAELTGGEILGADSVQVYRQFDVGSGKPTGVQLARAPHHLIDIVDPLEAMDAARWAALASQTIDGITRRGKRAIVCGGTFLWIKALLYGLAPAPPANEALREEHRARCASEGREALHRRLAEVDAASAARLAPNDFVRVSRALEVFELTGVTLSQWQAAHGFREARWSAQLVGVDRPRDELDRHIAERILAMLAAGWIDEVRGLLQRGYGEARAMRSVGYRQIAEALSQPPKTVEPGPLHESIYRATRVFARRQRTWLRDQPVRWLGTDDLARLDRLDW